MPDRARTAWLHTAARLVLAMAAALLVGNATGRVWPAVALAAIAVLAWHYWRLSGVLRRLASRQRTVPPGGRGVWNELERLLDHSHEDMRARNRRLADMLRAYRAAASTLPDAVVAFGRDDQRVQWFNDAAGTLLGLRYPDDIQGVLGERLPELPLERWVAEGGHVDPLLDLPSPVDPELRLSLRLIPYGESLWLLIARDVSKLMHLEQVRRDFVANVSHELRTPLTVVHGYLDMLEPEEDHPEWAPILEEMRRQSHRMSQLLEDLLALSRLEAQDTIDDEVVAMSPMLATLAREAEAISGGRHAVSVEDAAGVDLLGSSRELHSAFSNLVANAVRYTPTDGAVHVRLERTEDGGAALSVRDTGYGIPGPHLPRITERFYRVSTSRSRESGGTGLGLAIVKHVLHLHQSRLLIESEIGRGSTFTCQFGPARVRARGLHPSGDLRGQEETRPVA
jgi:two-component system, OmpR family, phosphate regulon sensor histidine kinase PhoR